MHVIKKRAKTISRKCHFVVKGDLITNEKYSMTEKKKLINALKYDMNIPSKTVSYCVLESELVFCKVIIGSKFGLSFGYCIGRSQR